MTRQYTVTVSDSGHAQVALTIAKVTGISSRPTALVAQVERLADERAEKEIGLYVMEDFLSDTEHNPRKKR